jgi:transcriptional regulator with XRE-family HTH domain
MVEKETRRLTNLLESLVRVKKMPVREVERRLDMAGGTMNRIFSGKIEIKLRHILAVLEVLEVPPTAFFQIAYEKGGEAVGVEQILARLERMGLTSRPEPPATQPVTSEDLRRTIAEVLQELGVVGAPARKGAEPAAAKPKAGTKAAAQPGKRGPRKQG